VERAESARGDGAEFLGCVVEIERAGAVGRQQANLG